MYDYKNCMITDLPCQKINGTSEAYEYKIVVGERIHFIRISYDCYKWINSQFFKKDKHIWAGLILNNKWLLDEDVVIEVDHFLNLSKERGYPSTPQQKLDNLFLELFKLQPSDGGIINLLEYMAVNEVVYRFYLRSADELNFYIKVLEQDGLIVIVDASEGFPKKFRCTYKGINHALKLEVEGDQSNKCFIAMSFNPKMEEARKAIKKAIVQTGFEPVIIDERNVESDRTINDEIIASLKKCKFCVADFTYQSKGVYFESGFAVGQGKKVIYTCEEEDFKKNAHFDIKPLQHILYSSTEQLTKDLINKIEAWIK